MALLKEWYAVAYDEKANKGDIQRFWTRYFELEKGVYEQLLTNSDEEVKGTVKELAEKENCVIVGRCGNYVLEEAENAVHVFIYADEEAKIKRTMERHQLNREEATKRMKKIDKQRRAYYQYYTEWRWARTEGFDLMLNSSALGVDATVAAIKAVVEAKMK